MLRVCFLRRRRSSAPCGTCRTRATSPTTSGNRWNPWSAHQAAWPTHSGR